MKIALIVAMANKRVIGVNNQLPWHLSADLKRFKQLTANYPLLMGRKTHESIGRALPNRRNLILTHDNDYTAKDCEIFTDLSAALNSCLISEKLFVIGGASLYQTLLPKADLLYITDIQKTFEGDVYFPEWQINEWQLIEQQLITQDKSVDFNYRFLTFQRLQSQSARL
ncbi:MAG: hypothetical protein RL637_688 [Pseudomonadota bacterium]|jgi:dihydrofolate reductase